MFLLPRPRRELAFVLAPTQRRAPPREMAPPRGRRSDQPRASGERRSAATMRRAFVIVVGFQKSLCDSRLPAATPLPAKESPFSTWAREALID